MKFFLPIAMIAACAFSALSLVACSKEDSTAGIEIGNPNLADQDTVASDTANKKQPALPLVADFSVDYSEISKKGLAKAVPQDEPVLLDSFALVLTEVRSFSSYYSSVSVDPVLGLQLWPYEDDPDEEINIEFAGGSAVEDAFRNIDLQEEGTSRKWASVSAPRRKTPSTAMSLSGKNTSHSFIVYPISSRSCSATTILK